MRHEESIELLASIRSPGAGGACDIPHNSILWKAGLFEQCSTGNPFSNSMLPLICPRQLASASVPGRPALPASRAVPGTGVLLQVCLRLCVWYTFSIFFQRTACVLSPFWKTIFFLNTDGSCTLPCGLESNELTSD